jgi:HSP90 family molecular chaperone
MGSCPPPPSLLGHHSYQQLSPSPIPPCSFVSQYTIAADPESTDKPGTTITLSLSETAVREIFPSNDAVSALVTKFSSFCAFPISLNGEKVGNFKPIWRESAQQVSDEDHAKLYRHLSKNYDSPMVTCMVAAEAPVEVKAVLYVPGMHAERQCARGARF